MNVLVTGAGSRIGQAIIKLIKKSKINISIFSTDYTKESIGFYWSDKFKVLPDILKVDEVIWLNSIEKIIKKNKIKLLIPGIDFELSFFAKHKSYLEKKYNLVCLISNTKEIFKYNNKYQTYKFLEKHGISVPKTALLKEKNVFLKYNKYPVILKPITGSTSKGLHCIHNKKELDKLNLLGENYLIQEKLKGFEITSGVIVFDKKIYSMINLKRTLRNGNTHSASLYLNKKVDDFIKKIVKISNFCGPINFQLFYYKGKITLIEINPRFSGTSFSRSLFGLNEFTIIHSILFKKYKKLSYKLKKGSIIKYIEDEFIEGSKKIL